MHPDAESGNATSADESIQIRGARVHNLKNVNLSIPRGQLVVFTGPSGSGKSSLAFDTIYAEGQRQYIESLSVYARQFLDQMQRPDVDMIWGLEPTICIDQRPGIANPRSTVATVTEIYDYLRLLMARVGQPTCYQCGHPIRQQTAEQIQDRLMSLPENTKVMVLAPIVRGRRGAHKDVFAQIRKAGLIRSRVNGEIYDIESVPELALRKNHRIDAVVDRIVINSRVATRLAESIQLAVKIAEGLVVACVQCREENENSQSGEPVIRWRDQLFSTIYACPKCNISFEEVQPRTFSFNSPYGACPKCDGLGQSEQFDLEMVIPDCELTLGGGAIAPWKTFTQARLNSSRTKLNELLESLQISWESTRLSELDPAVFDRLVHGDQMSHHGVLTLLEKEFATATSSARQEQLAAFRGHLPCTVCRGSRLRPEAASVRIGGKAIHEITRLTVDRARDFMESCQFGPSDQPIAQPIVHEIGKRLEFLEKVGVNYLSLDRAADTLSGGELQRVRLARSIGSGLVGVCYVLDEPSIGLHARDNQRLIDAMRDLQQRGNTVLVVEHDEMVMRQADHLIDIGPEAGQGGGRIVVEGAVDDVVAHADSSTGQYLAGTLTIDPPVQRRRGSKSRQLRIDGVTTNNLNSVDAVFPIGTLICVTGVSGSGKSSLINETLAHALLRRLGNVAPKPGPFKSLRGASQIDRVIQIDQSPIGRSPRSNAATYTGAFDEIRKLFASTRAAKQLGFRANRFSFNVKAGRCEACQGHGVTKIEMNFLPDLFVTCGRCAGARFNRQTLTVRFRGKSIADVLEMSIAEATEFFENFSTIHRQLTSLVDVGLGYLALGQPSTMLSGGEAQRIKIATQLARVDSGSALYLLDEPTTGLHFADIQQLMAVLNRLVDRGNTVIVIEHHMDVIKCADWVIDLGPDGGDRGGHVVAAGTPEEIARVKESHTGRYLSRLMRTPAR